MTGKCYFEEIKDFERFKKYRGIERRVDSQWVKTDRTMTYRSLISTADSRRLDMNHFLMILSSPTPTYRYNESAETLHFRSSGTIEFGNKDGIYRTQELNAVPDMTIKIPPFVPRKISPYGGRFFELETIIEPKADFDDRVTL